MHWSPRLKAWVLTRYDDVRQVLLDREISSDRMRPFFATLPGPEAARIADIVRYLSTWMVFRDPPEHTRLRRLTGRDGRRLPAWGGSSSSRPPIAAPR